jgi:acid stress-induced BolA-like protein IbaG/YrbA
LVHPLILAAWRAQAVSGDGGNRQFRRRGNECDNGGTDDPISTMMSGFPGASAKNTGNEGDQSMDSSTIERMIRAGLPDAQVEVSGSDGVHFEAVVVSPSFRGLPTLKRHRLVYASLGSLMGQEIHALGLRTLTPEEQHR